MGQFLLFSVGFVQKIPFLAKLEDDTADADLVEGADPIGDIFGDLLKGAGALLTEGIKIVTDVTDGSVSTSYSSNFTACTVKFGRSEKGTKFEKNLPLSI